MIIRFLIAAFALLAASCSTGGKNSAIIVTKFVLGTTQGTADAGVGPPPACTYDSTAHDFSNANINPATNVGSLGVVIANQLASTTSLNTVLRTDSTLFSPHQVVADYEVIGGNTTIGQIIPVSGGAVSAGGTSVVIVPFFAPAAVKGLTGTIRVSFHIEGKLEDGSTVHTSQHEYIFVTCSTAGCSDTCL